jgi:pimeloyl-ACP methyl ester carboxylesterase
MKSKFASLSFHSAARYTAHFCSAQKTKTSALPTAQACDRRSGPWGEGGPLRSLALNPVSIRLLLLAFVAWGICSSSLPVTAQSSPSGRPILFVHGICDTSVSWAPLQASLINYVTSMPGSLYTNAVPWTIYYDTNSQTVKTWPDGQDFLTTVPSTTRFFSINLFDPSSTDFSSINKVNVAQVSILNKGDEIAQVIQAITTLTRVKDVIVIGHSQGGLDARAYIENQAIPYYWGICSDQNGYGCFATPNTYYTQDIYKLITLDTPHSGAETANWVSWLNLSITDQSSPLYCWSKDTLNRRELQDTSFVVDLLTENAANAPSGLTIASIQSYTSPGFAPSGGPDGDEVVTFQEQSIQTVAPSVTSYYDVPDYFGSYFPFYLPPNTILSPLHLLTVVGAQPATANTLEVEIDKVLLHGTPALTTSITVQTAAGVSYTISGPATLSGTGPNTFYGMPVGTYTLSYPSGSQQQTLGVDHSTGANNWDLTFTISSSSGSIPIVITSPATIIGSDGANLNGTVNPNGSAVTAWFEYGTSSTLNPFQSTSPVQLIPSGTSSVPVTFSLNYQSANTQFYYRLAVSNGVTTTRGTILSFKTLNILPPPTLLTPGNSSTGASLTPQLSWTAVSGATSGYRVMMSTSMTSLPTDPNLDACSGGCVLGSIGATASGTTFSPSAGELSSSTTYYWEVHGRSPTQAGAWSSPIWSFMTGPAVSNDFSLTASPTSQSVPQGSNVAFNILTATTSGSGQNIALIVSNVPSWLTASFNPTTVASGVQSALTVAASSSAPTGTYNLTITGTGTSATQTYQISVTVVQAATGPAVTLTPSIVRFNSQAVGSVSAPQTVMLMNSGSGQLKVSSIALSAGSDYVLSLPSPAPPNILNAEVPYNIQVAFEPTTTGTRNGEILVYDNAQGSPHVVSLTGTGTAAPPSTGTIIVNETLNGTALPLSGYYSGYSLSGPTSSTGGGVYSYSVSPGPYTIAFSGNPNYLTLSSVTPSAAQSVAAGGTVTFTLNFTASNDFYAPTFTSPAGGSGVTPQVVTAGSMADYTVGLGVPGGSASTPITLAVSGIPPNSNPVFNPQPVYSENAGALSVGTTSATPIGAYALSLSGTNTSGLTHDGGTSTIVVTAPPVQPVQLASESSGNIQANAASSVSYDSVSADGRYVVFSTPATNLASGNTYQYSEVYVRDLQLSTTTPVSMSNSGALADSGCYGGSISANGQFVVFWSGADNLYTGSSLNTTNGVYVYNLSQTTIEREDVASNGTPANGTSFGSAISADGRFVAFVSNASNLVSGVSGMQAYLRDRKTGQIVLVSAALDGSPASSDSDPLEISADGRFVAFVSNATNLVSQNTNGLDEAFVRDVAAGETYLVSVSNTGVPANASVFTDGDAAPLGLSADGRFVAFSSLATNLVSQPLDGTILHVFLYDRQLQQNTLIDVDSVGTPLGGWQSFTAPSVSADGRFITFYGFEQVLVRDAVANQTAVVSLASNGAAGNNTTYSAGWDLSLGKSEIVFASLATNLVANESNGVANAFVAQNPFVGTSSLQSMILSSSTASGSSTVTGTITLSSPAPTGGATVSVWSNNASAQPPAEVVVPAGATSAPVRITTSLVPSESVMTIMASYNGGSGVAVLTLEPAAELAVSPTAWDYGYQAVGTTSAIESFALTNSGTAALAINSVQLLYGQVFSIGTNTCGSSIAAGGSCSVSVTFKPGASGPASDAIQISYGTAATTQSITLAGNGATPLATLYPAPLSFGNQSMPGSSTSIATLSNNGNASLTNIAASISGANAADFAISSNGCSGVILPANSNCLVTIAFTPKAQGSRQATLSIADSESGSPQTINMTGTGVQSTPTLIWNPSAVSIAYGTPLGSGILDATANQNDSNLAGTFAYTATINGGTPQTVTQATVLGAGVYTLTATFSPTDTTDYTSAIATVSLTVNKTTPTVMVTPGSSSITTAQTLTVTVTVSGGTGNPTPTGSVILTGGGYTSAAATLTSGSATINISAGKLATGPDTLTATYTPDSSSSSTYNSATGTSRAVTVTQAVTTPTVSVTPSSSSITTAQALTVTVAVSGGSGNPTPTGSVTLIGGGYTSAAIILSSGSATVIIPANSLSAGTDSLAVSYTPDSSSSSTYNSASGSVTVTVTTPAKTTPTVTVTPSASSITTTQPLTVTVAVNGGTGNPTPTGSVTLTGGGYTSAATTLSSKTASINIPAGSLATGNDTLTVSYIPDSNSSSTYNSAAGSNSVTVTIPAKTTPTVTVTPSASSITTAQALTVTVTVSGTPVPTGSVTLTGGGYTSAATTLSGGSATIIVPAGSLATGSGTLTASYTGDSNYSATTGTAPVTITTAANPTFTVGGTSVTVTPGATTGNTLTITVTPSGGFTGSVALTAVITSSPTSAQYPPTLSFGSTSPVSIGGSNAGTATLTVYTTAATSASIANPVRRGFPWYTEGGAALACILLIGIPTRRRRWRTMLGALALLVTLTAVSLHAAVAAVEVLAAVTAIPVPLQAHTP